MQSGRYRDRVEDGGAGAAPRAPTGRSAAAVEEAIDRAAAGLKREQSPEGYWCYEFEADATIPSEYVLMMHFMDEVDPEIEAKIGTYLRRRQGDDGSWPLYFGGEMDMSATVKAYWALKVIGDSPDEPHMVRAREAILARGGAACANVFTRITMALFGHVPWRAVPFIPVEIMLLPKWFPFHITKVSYWSRVVMVPLFVLCTRKPRAANPRGTRIDELFVTPPDEERDYFPVRSWLNRAFLWLDLVGRTLHPLVPGALRRLAIRRAEQFVTERLNGYDGLGAIFPAMVNAHEMFAILGYPPDHTYRVQTRRALEALLIVKDDEAYCQPCLSPIWDTGLACLALQAAERRGDVPEVVAALDWLRPLQLLDQPGDWQWKRPNLRGGGWAFEFGNDPYPDIDDTPVVAWGMLQAGQPRHAESMARAAEWIAGMQSTNGGWASFDVDNDHYYLNEIPFADHGALLDPPTGDVTARCVTFLSLYGRERYDAEISRGLAFLAAEQEPDGSWFGRWGTNYVYGTWSVLTALEAAGVGPHDPRVRRAAAWLGEVQRDDGGWGEDNYTYYEPARAGRGPRSTSFQTAWALFGLVAAGEGGSDAARRAAAWLVEHQRADGLWYEPDYTAPGFPRVFYLKYHGYSRYFPLWALARYRDAANS